jgi:hypothetical protein
MSATARPAEKPGDPPTRPPVKTGITLSADASYRLKSAALHERKTMSELVEMLVVRHLGAYYTSKRSGTEAASGAGG